MKRRTFKAKAPRERLTINWNGSTLVTVGVLIFGVLLTGPKIGEYFAMQTQIAQLKAKLDASKQHLTDRWNDPVFIRAQARDRLFYVVPGEISYLVLDADGLNLSDTSGTVGAKLAQEKNSNNFSQSIGTTKKDWAKGLLQSVLVAGLDQPVANGKPTASK
ncbi:MAG: septum formation initiator family protein [Micrococcales bacterium]|nr:septum formation initiator family protein [Micrococcales bacterium]